MREFNRIDHGLFFHFFRARLDHHDGFRGSDHHDVDQALAHFGIGGVGDEAPLHQPDAHRANRSQEWNVRQRQRRRGPVDRNHIRIILSVSREHQGNHLRLALESFLEHRTNRPVDLAAGQNFALARTPFALDEAARDASAGVGVLPVVHGEREEVDALAGLGIGDGGGEHHIFAQAYHGGAVRLLGKFSGFK